MGVVSRGSKGKVISHVIDFGGFLGVYIYTVCMGGGVAKQTNDNVLMPYWLIDQFLR